MFSKVIRENSRTFVLVVMSLLLVTFLLSDVLQSCSDRTGNALNEKLGVAFAAPVSMGDVQRAGDKLHIVRAMGIIPGDVSNRIDELDYHLLVTEAKRAGVYVGRADLQREFQDNPFMMQRLDDIRTRFHVSLDTIYDTLGDWLAVQNFWLIQREALGGSLPRAEVAYRNQHEEASVLLSALDAKAFLATIPEPTEQELAEFFDQTKDRMAQHTSDKLEFGYKYPDRVQFEYATVDPRSMQDSVQVRAAEVRRFFDANAKRYEQKVPRPTTLPTDPEQAKAPEFDTVMPSFEDVQNQVREDCRAAKAIDEAQRIVNQIRDRLNEPWAALESGADGYHPAPPAEKIESLEAICASFASSGVTVTYKKSEMVDAAGMIREGMIAQSVYTASNQQIRFPEIVMRVRGLYAPKLEKEHREIFPVMNLMEPGPTMVNLRPAPGMPRAQQFVPYQAFVYRVIQIAPSAAPLSIDEVRTKVVADWKTAQAYKKAEEFAKKLADRAKAVGLDAAVNEMTELKELLTKADTPPTTQPGELPPRPTQYMAALGPIVQEKFSRTPRLIHSLIGYMPNLNKQVFELADLTSETTRPAHSIVLVPNAQAQKWVVGELKEVKPLYQGDFDAQREAMQRRAASEEDSRFYNAWFEPESIRERCGYVSAKAAK